MKFLYSHDGKLENNLVNTFPVDDLAFIAKFVKESWKKKIQK